MSAIHQLQNDFVIHEKRFFPADHPGGASALELQYRWPGTPGVEALRLVLIPRFRSQTQPLILGNLSMCTDFRSLRMPVKQKGIFSLVLQARFAGDREEDFTDTEILDMTITAGPIETPHYTVSAVSGGWSRIELHISDPLSAELYADHLWVTYGGCRYRYPGLAEGNRDCYVPYQGGVELRLFPAGLLQEPICD